MSTFGKNDREFYPHARAPRIRLIDMAEAGGWLVQIVDDRGDKYFVFAPNMAVWAAANAAAIVAAQNEKVPISVALDMDHATDKFQPRPTR